MNAASILEAMESVEGWFRRDEGELLLASAVRALSQRQAQAIVEVGSYCGRSTVVLGSAARLVRPAARVHAIDPHEGEVSSLSGTEQRAPTLELFERNMRTAGISEAVQLWQKKSYEVAWTEPIALLFIDGLHDYDNVSRDFHHFEKWVEPGGFIAFHDYSNPDYPGVKKFVDEVAALPAYRALQGTSHLMVLQKRSGPGEAGGGELTLDGRAAAEELLAQVADLAIGRAAHFEGRLQAEEARAAGLLAALAQARAEADAARAEATRWRHEEAQARRALEEMAGSLAVRSARLVKDLAPAGHRIAGQIVRQFLGIIKR